MNSENEPVERERESWSSRAAFIVAAIGAAVGFGNVWRFPNLANKFGGGAFFIPYLLALFIIGIPILILEITVGQFYQTGDAGAFGRINKRFRGIGLASVLSAFLVCSYYCVLIAWVLRMFVYSIQGSEGRWSGVTDSEAFNWFLDVVTGLETATGSNRDEPTRLVGANVGALAIVWFFIFVCLAFGVKWTGRIAYFTVGLPVLFLFVLLIRAVTLDGASDGVRSYIGEWDVNVLSDRAEVWSEAVSQVFFSIGVTFGVMTAYASYNKRDSPVFTNSVIIAISNSVYSIIAGFAVFGSIGYIAKRDNIALDKVESGGVTLIFNTYPVALSTLPGAGHWERLLFVVLFLLGIDSAFALTEAVITVMHDTALLKRVPRVYISGGVCLAGFLGGLLYCTDTGLWFLDVADYYINFMMILVGFFECFSVGWIYGIESQIEKLGAAPVVGFAFAVYSSIIVASGIWFGVDSDPIWKGFVALVVCFAVLMCGVLFLCKKAMERPGNEMTWIDVSIELLMGNMLKFRRELVGVVRYIPLLWFILIRLFIPPLLLVVFANLASVDNGDKKDPSLNFGNYGKFAIGYQAFGITLFGLTCIVITVGLVFPQAYACFDIKTVPDADEKETKEVMRRKLEDEEGEQQLSGNQKV